MTPDLQQSIREAARILRESRYVISLVGAGISAESGIPTFRGPGGLWTRMGEPPMNQYEQFLQDPKGWWRRRMQAQASGEMSHWEDAKPNPAHYALARLEDMGIMRHVITQNIDNLHQVAGTRSISEFHGNRYKLRCIGCNTRWDRDELEVSPHEPPDCPHCGALVKSDTVMFGEPIPPDAISRSFDEAEKADCCLVIGTSAVVYPAANVPLIVRRNGGRLIEVNPLETALSGVCDVALRGPAGEVLPALVRELEA
ncbi:MAG TPA: NAD-dependent deacylase [Dehalococcoidia bacterium]|nr:NAD-dependent deacylase [Dehalococcoidia bacterium]